MTRCWLSSVETTTTKIQTRKTDLWSRFGHGEKWPRSSGRNISTEDRASSFLETSITGKSISEHCCITLIQAKREKEWTPAKATAATKTTARATAKATTKANSSGSVRKFNEFLCINKIILGRHKKGVEWFTKRTKLLNSRQKYIV